MVELGRCQARCRVVEKCFFVKSYFLCSHLLCYNVANKFRCCIVCGEARWRATRPRAMERDFVEVEMTNSILNRGGCEKICCCRAT